MSRIEGSGPIHLTHAFAAILVGLTFTAEAQAQRRTFGPGVCGPLDAAYVNTASETGGQPFPMSPAELVNMSVVMAEATRSDSVLLLWAGGTRADDTTFTIPVDPAVSRVTFSTTFDGTGGAVTIAGPDGTVVKPGPAVQDTSMSCGRIVSVDAPTVGDWRVTVQPTERFWLVIHGRSELDLMSADFVRPGGRPGHEGLFKMEGRPVAGRPAMLRVRLSDSNADAKAPVFTLLSSQGKPIRTLDLAPVDDREFVGPIDLPTLAFRVAVTSLDGAGTNVQRVHARLFRAEPIEVVPGAPVKAAAGRESTVVFVVRNLGPPARFRMTALADGQLVPRVEPAVVDIEQGAEQRVIVRAPVPATTAIDSEIEIRLVASLEGTKDPHFNSGVQRVLVVKD
jgi:von Willebrand factor A domain-containing protein 7